jgi:hypothetical protein
MAEVEIIIGGQDSLRERMMTVWDLVCRGIKAGPVVVTLGRPKRRGDQNRHFHALIGEIAQQVTPGGLKFSADVFKALLIDQFEQEMEAAGTPISKPGRTVPSLDGRRAVTVRPSTTCLKEREAADFIEFLYSWGVEHDVTFTPPTIEIYQQYREAA